MAARRGKSQARRGNGMKYGLVMGLGLLLGLGLAAAYLMYGDRQPLDALLPQPNPAAQAPAPNREREPVAQEPARPRFDFYTMLPERQVELPGEAPPAAAPSPANVVPLPPGDASSAPAQAATPLPTTPAAAGGGQLQAGAFSTAADAEAMRAKLALLGQVTRIETVEANGRTLHRVRLGPFATEAERAAVQARLADAGVNTTPAR